MSKILKVGIIGCGGIANAKHLLSLGKLDNVEVVAFCDIIKERAVKTAEKFGAKGAKVYTDYKELLKEDLDAVHVCTPNISHDFITVDALESGKHVMCEKPMAKTPEGALKMLEAAKRTGKKLTVGYQTRHALDSKYLKNVCKNDELGDIYYAKAHAIRRRGVPTWGVFLDAEAQGGGPLIDIGTHALDLTLWLMNNYKPKMVVGSVYRKLADQKETGNPWGDWDPNEFTVEDSAFGYITMENGATIVLESSWAINMRNPEEAKATLCGTKAGADMIDGLHINGVKYNAQYVETPALSAGGVAFFDGSKYSPADQEAKEWIDAIVNDTEVFVKPEEAYVVTQILDAIYKSAETAKPVYFN